MGSHATEITSSIQERGSLLIAMGTYGEAASVNLNNAVGSGLRRSTGFELVIGSKQHPGDGFWSNGKTLNSAGIDLYPFFKSTYVNEWGSGRHYNHIPDWQKRFWGSEKYARLLHVKQKYDPCNMLGVYNGVGYDEPLGDGC